MLVSANRSVYSIIGISRIKAYGETGGVGAPERFPACRMRGVGNVRDLDASGRADGLGKVVRKARRNGGVLVADKMFLRNFGKFERDAHRIDKIALWDSAVDLAIGLWVDISRDGAQAQNIAPFGGELCCENCAPGVTNKMKVRMGHDRDRISQSAARAVKDQLGDTAMTPFVAVTGWIVDVRVTGAADKDDIGRRISFGQAQRKVFVCGGAVSGIVRWFKFPDIPVDIDGGGLICIADSGVERESKLSGGDFPALEGAA